MTWSSRKILSSLASCAAFAGLAVTPLAAAHAEDQQDFEVAFDSTFGTSSRVPPAMQVLPTPSQKTFLQLPQPLQTPRSYRSPLEARIAAAASAELGRIGVAAIDLSSGQAVSILGDQPFPMASTSKVAIVATFLDGVDRGRFRLSDQYPLMVPVPSRKFAGPVAPVRAGTMLSAHSLIELTITRSDNQATDALLAAVGGPQAVNRWLRSAGIENFRIDRDIATLVRDDGEVDPAAMIDLRDSATPTAMVELLSGIYRGQWLKPASRAVLMGAMERCITGKRRIPAMLPEGARVAHKTGSLNNTSSDVGIIKTPDGRAMAVAIYVTGQGGKLNREARIASIARTIYDGYLAEASGTRRTAAR